MAPKNPAATKTSTTDEQEKQVIVLLVKIENNPIYLIMQDLT